MIIPIGVDLTHFEPYNLEKRMELKEKYNLPKNKTIIGSFQKDGVGWEEGIKPKLIKGPDTLCEVLHRIHSEIKIHVFLTGPARGYVKQKLREYNIPYTHIYLNNYLDIVECYNILDLYLITSRIEGGPQALLEGMATGVPLVSTKVGMASEIIENGVNGFIAEVDDIEMLYKYSKTILSKREVKETLVKNGLNIVQNFGWEHIAKDYYNKIYKRLLD